MILDLDRFVRQGEPGWKELDSVLTRLERSPASGLTVAEMERLHMLYQRASTDLLRVRGLHSEARLRQYLEALVARAYTAIHSTAETAPARPLDWLLVRFPRAVRGHRGALGWSAGLFTGGILIGALLLILLPTERRMLMPFEPLADRTPSERVAAEQKDSGGRVGDHAPQFSAMLIENNTRVAALTAASGMTFGALTTVILFGNGVFVGAVAADYIRDGQALFLFGWLLPHGVVELPAIVLAGQAAFVLAGALLRRGRRAPRRERVSLVLPDLLALLAGIAALLVWAGIVEAFLSQYHEPVLPYAVKIAIGLAEAAALGWFLLTAGRERRA